MNLARRAEWLGTENAFSVLAEVQRLARDGRDVVNLGIGDPDFDTPDNVKGAAVAALQQNRTHYSPSAGVLEPADLEAVAEVARERDCWVLADEIYSEYLYGGRHASITALPGMKERTILLDGFSKTYAMTGWRLGYGAMERRLADHL